ncbi:MAG TPA: bifunctional homocysteine S-methyltransferase/methylenetetrahydrofolate reductase [Streptosporangiaceae bacterium]|nr:bifunctional homocysteine S-methyltransferase/methylenetetrahydrofolate reductase [Streptosporangiaceae bacterium]
MRFDEACGRRILIGDGAMGTMLHAAGNTLDRALPELNLSDPSLVATIHESYLSSGADLIQTNTFGANRLWLGDQGYADKVTDINRAGVRLAAAAARESGREVFVAGSVSPAVTALQRHRVDAAERAAVLREQIEVLVGEGVDVVVLETFGYLDELVEAVRVAADVGDVPIIAQATFAGDGHTLGGETAHEVASALSGLPIAMLGTNCTIGPQRMLSVVEDLIRFTSLPVSAQPNAGQPRLLGRRRFEFNIDGTYFARYLRRFAEAGAGLVGGCCGTTPTHIRVAADSIAEWSGAAAGSAARPVTRPAPYSRGPEPVRIGEGGLADRLTRRRFVTAAEIEPPVGGVADTAMDTVAALRGRGIALYAVSAGDSARARLGSVSMALHLQQHAGVESVATVTTWDKSIMTLQAELLGAHALGMRSIICETGNPPVLGDYPAVDGVWEVDALGLISLLSALNSGRDSNGLPLTTKTSFCIGARINPGAEDLTTEITRSRAKIRAGAQFLVTSPVYELAALRRMVDALAEEDVPILLSVAPLLSFEEADYLAHEVPDVTIPAATLTALESAGAQGARSAHSARSVGLDLMAGLLTEARPLVDGVVVRVPGDDLAALDPLLAALA